VISVFLVDDETLVRQGFRRLLELARDVEVVGEAPDGHEALARVPRTTVDVLLLDIRMPRQDGLQVLEALGRLGQLPATLVLTTFDDAELLLGAVRLGARGFMKKDVSLEELLAAIRTLARGETWFQPALTSSLRRGLEARPTPFASCDLPDALTDREREVLRLMAGGYSNREIAATLDTAEGTVKNQVSSILSKIGVRDRTRAVLRAIESGLI
jgi:DNA-binding NarL/FixJ family response regulator